MRPGIEVKASILNRNLVEGKVYIRIFRMGDVERIDERMTSRVMVLMIYCYLSQISSENKVTWLQVVTARVVPHKKLRVLTFLSEFARLLFHFWKVNRMSSQCRLQRALRWHLGENLATLKLFPIAIDATRVSKTSEVLISSH